MLKFACLASLICLCQSMAITTVNVNDNVINAFINTVTNVKEARGNPDTNEVEEVMAHTIQKQIIEQTLKGIGMVKQASNDKSTKDTRGCCFPKEWQTAIVEQVFFNGSLYNLYADYASDQPRHSVAFRVMNSSFNELFRVVADYNKNASWVIVGDKCNLTMINATWREQCIPEDAHFVGGAHVGLFPHEIHVDTYAFRGAPGSEFIMSVTENCFPVAMRTKLESNSLNQTIEANLFNGEEHISDPGLFHVPDFCPSPEKLTKDSEVMDMYNLMAKILKRT